MKVVEGMADAGIGNISKRFPDVREHPLQETLCEAALLLEWPP